MIRRRVRCGDMRRESHESHRSALAASIAGRGLRCAHCQEVRRQREDGSFRIQQAEVKGVDIGEGFQAPNLQLAISGETDSQALTMVALESVVIADHLHRSSVALEAVIQSHRRPIRTQVAICRIPRWYAIGIGFVEALLRLDAPVVDSTVCSACQQSRVDDRNHVHASATRGLRPMRIAATRQLLQIHVVNGQPTRAPEDDPLLRGAHDDTQNLSVADLADEFDVEVELEPADQRLPPLSRLHQLPQLTSALATQQHILVLRQTRHGTDL
mmetsp:Transcript_121800/g.389446  ORF Transcript_121800/g.389446 Transcript_121800/m.389446 type:complete len:271 (-) Transcript_121800:458-1270(-)